MPAAGQHGTGVPRTIPKASGAVAGTGDGGLGTTPGGRMQEVVGVLGVAPERSWVWNPDECGRLGMNTYSEPGPCSLCILSLGDHRCPRVGQKILLTEALGGRGLF